MDKFPLFIVCLHNNECPEPTKSPLSCTFSGGGKFVKNTPLTEPSGQRGRQIHPAWIPVNFFEKGVDFLGKVRYNLFLHKGHSMPGRIFEQEV